MVSIEATERPLIQKAPGTSRDARPSALSRWVPVSALTVIFLASFVARMLAHDVSSPTTSSSPPTRTTGCGEPAASPGAC